MIKEEYVSFETAKLLKEKGFNQVTIDSYRANGQLRGEYKSCNYPCPTQQMACRWLREVHGLFISIGNDDLDYNWQIFDVKNRTEDLDPTCLTESYAGYKTYEEAVEVAIKYCLENLI